MTKPFFLLICLTLLAGRTVADDGPDAVENARRLKRELPSTWETTSHADLPAHVRFIKHVTPTAFTWVLYDSQTKAILGVTGGTWSLKEGKYEESIDFASDNVQQLRGKSFPFTINLVGDKWEHKALPDAEVEADEVWTRMKPAANQKANTAEPGRQLQATWDRVFGPEAPKAARTVKHITPTHWTWVAYDRENRRVLAAAGGTWSLQNGEYVEECVFSTDNLPQLRERSFPFAYQLDGDRWTLKGGPDRAIRDDETWKRRERPNP